MINKNISGSYIISSTCSNVELNFIKSVMSSIGVIEPSHLQIIVNGVEIGQANLMGIYDLCKGTFTDSVNSGIYLEGEKRRAYET